MALYERNIRHKGSGSFMKGRAGQALGSRKLVYRTNTGVWNLADADALASLPVVGLTMGPVNAGQIVEILLEGFIGSSAWAWTRGDTLYASQVAGEIVAVAPVPPATAQMVGVALTPTTVYFNGLPASKGIAIGGGVDDFTYLVERTGANYTVYDDHGAIVHGPGIDADTEINWALTTGGAGCVVYLKEDNIFAINDPIVFTANNQVIRGGGRGTFIDGDGLATTEHGIVLSGFTDCIMRDFSIQTQDGGIKTCHCIFIEDGADRFLIENVVFVNSDHSDIWIEGTTIEDGHIHNCKLLGADNDCIYIDIDDANYLYRLKITDCEIAAGGARGIMFAATTGGYVNTIIQGNTIHGNGYEGIFAYDIEGSTIEANEIFSNGWSGIYIHTVTGGVGIHDNDCYQNVRHGIFFTAVDNSIIEGNRCFENDFLNTTTYDGIYLDGDSDDNLVLGNKCNDNDNYGINVAGARTRVKENDLSGNTTGQFNDGGTDTRTPFLFSQVSDPITALGRHPVQEMPYNTDTHVYGQFYVPLEYQELVSAHVLVVAAATGDMVWTVNTDYGKVCASADYNEHSDVGGGTDTLTITDIECIDISGALDTPDVAAGDLVGVDFMRDGDAVADTIDDFVYYLGIRVRYV